MGFWQQGSAERRLGVENLQSSRSAETALGKLSSEVAEGRRLSSSSSDIGARDAPTCYRRCRFLHSTVGESRVASTRLHAACVRRLVGAASRAARESAFGSSDLQDACTRRASCELAAVWKASTLHALRAFLSKWHWAVNQGCSLCNGFGCPRSVPEFFEGAGTKQLYPVYPQRPMPGARTLTKEVRNWAGECWAEESLTKESCRVSFLCPSFLCRRTLRMRAGILGCLPRRRSPAFRKSRASLQEPIFAGRPWLCYAGGMTNNQNTADSGPGTQPGKTRTW